MAATTSSGIAGAGGALSQPVPEAQSRTYCLSNDGWPRPGSYSSAGQKREESGVQTSSPSVSSPSASRPNSNFVSARMTPALARVVGDRGVDGERHVAQPLGQLAGADELGRAVEVDRLVVARPRPSSRA